MKRTTSQHKGDLAETQVLYTLSKNSQWIGRKVDKDFGVDIEMECVDKQAVTGQYIKVQVKGVSSFEIIDGLLKYRISTNFLKYCDECRVPILLVVINAVTSEGLFIWVQEYLRNYKPDLTKRKTVNVFIPATNDFDKGLNNVIRDIASGVNHTQLQLDLKASLTSAFLLGDKEIYEKLTELSLDIAKTNAYQIHQIIDDLILLGNKALATHEGNQKANILYSFCRRFGDRFTTQQIERLVIRGANHSRVGINALGILYDDFPEYIKSLNLPIAFEKYDDPGVSYFCLLRERYLGRKGSVIIMDKRTDFAIGNFFISDEDRFNLFSKWPNRGESIILDYLDLTPEARAKNSSTT